MEWISLLQTLGGIAGGLGIGMFTKSGRRKTKADADARVAEAQKLMIENYEARIKDLHSSIETLNKSEAHYIERISQQNHALDSKTEQIRNLTDKLYSSEQEVNRVQDMLNEANGRPHIVLGGEVERRLRASVGTPDGADLCWFVSISHDGPIASAVVVLCAQ